VNWSDEKESKVTAEELERLVKVWENKAGRRSGTGNKVSFVMLRLFAFGLVLLAGFFGLRALSLFFRENSFTNGWQFALVQAALALVLGWAALRCWRLAGSS
jgi:hypothetical protein